MYARPSRYDRSRHGRYYRDRGYDGQYYRRGYFGGDFHRTDGYFGGDYHRHDGYFAGDFHRGFYQRPHYRYYRGYQRCYGAGFAFYRPPYYRQWYDWSPSHTYFIYNDLAVPRVYDTSVVYTDTIVTEPATVAGTYYTTTVPESTTTIVEPTIFIESEIGVVEPETPAVESDTAVIEPTTMDDALGTEEGAEETAESLAPVLVGKGNEAFAAGQYDEARGWYTRAILEDETDGYAKLFYGLANFAIGEYAVAAGAFRDALADAPELIDDPLDLRAVYSDPEVFKAQMADLRRVMGERPEDEELVFLLGYLYFATGAPQEAITMLQPVTGPDSDDILAGLVRDAAIRVLPEDAGMAESN